MSSLVNKVKEALHSDKDKSTVPEGTHGTHNSRAANAADPRIDSDRDHRAAHDLSGTGTHIGSGQYTTDNRPLGGTDGPATKTDGPHNSNLLNKADPRVDSDRDHSTNLGANPHGTSTTGAYGSSNTHSSTLGGNQGAIGGHNTTNTGGYSGGIQEGAVGTHNSRVANAADPRIDSDLDGSRTLGSKTQGTHAGAYSGALGSSTGTHGTHAGGLGSSTTHNTTATGGAYGSGPAPNTVGPHKSDMLNKIDPRVDSNLDGSKTVGGDKTFQRSNDTTSAYAHKDPTDAAQVPPSVLQQHIGAPTIAHDDHTHDRARRHSVSHQDGHRGL